MHHLISSMLLTTKQNHRINVGYEVFGILMWVAIPCYSWCHFSVDYCYFKLINITILWFAWRRHQMDTFSALLAHCAGNSPVTGEFSAQRPVTLSFDVFFDVRLNKRLSKQPWGWWFDTSLRSLWRHSNGNLLSFRFIWWHQCLFLHVFVCIFACHTKSVSSNKTIKPGPSQNT